MGQPPTTRTERDILCGFYIGFYWFEKESRSHLCNEEKQIYRIVRKGYMEFLFASGVIRQVGKEDFEKHIQK